MKISVVNYKSPVGELLIGSFQDQLCLVDWKYRKMRSAIDQRICKGLNASYTEENSEINQKAISQLQSYFTGEITWFDLPIKMVGTPFQVQVWEALQKIPFGETKSYLQLSKSLNNEKAIRAVAAANGANAISIILPCHRIIGSKGDLIGYAGGLKAKEKLLELENSLPIKQMSLF